MCKGAARRPPPPAAARRPPPPPAADPRRPPPTTPTDEAEVEEDDDVDRADADDALTPLILRHGRGPRPVFDAAAASLREPGAVGAESRRGRGGAREGARVIVVDGLQRRA